VKVLVTGATGFIGQHVASLLVEQGDEVRVLIRTGSPVVLPSGLPVRQIPGDIRDRDACIRAARGCEGIFHVAADYRLWVPNPAEMFATNVEGTVNMMEAALRCDAQRVVYTSTVGALGIPADGAPGNEDTPVFEKNLFGPYKRSKYLAEQRVLDFAAKGLPVVVVNPSAPVGPGDHKPTPTGKVIVDFLNRRIPAFMDTGLNLVHVKDVAMGHLLAYRKGRIGERYILGNRNLSFSEILRILGNITGLPVPVIRLPYSGVLAAAYFSEGISRWITGKEPRIPLNAVKMARKPMFFDATKAVRELGFPQTSVKQALSDAVDWFRDRKYVSRTGRQD